MTADFDLYLITDRKAVPKGQLPRVIAEALEAGVSTVQLREKDLPDSELLSLAAQLRDLTCRHGARLLINARVDIALACDADGVHLGVTSPERDKARERLGPDKLIGFSTHNRAEIALAEQTGADFVTFGPVFATPSKLAYGPPAGLDALSDACSNSRLPVFALGGVTTERLPALRRAGAAGFSCIRAVLAASSPHQAVIDMQRTWSSYR